MIKYFINYQENKNFKKDETRKKYVSMIKENVGESTCISSKNNNLILDLNKMNYNRWEREDLYELTIITK
jgi:hypothetical protein